MPNKGSLLASRFSPLQASLFFLALACVLPFLQWHHKPPIPSFYSEWLAFGLGLLAALPLLSKRYWQPMVLPRSLLFLLGFIAIVLVQLMLDRIVYSQQAFVAALYILWASLMLWLGQQLRREVGVQGIADTLAWAFLVGALLSAGVALVQHFAWHTPLDAWINRKLAGPLTANLGQPNHFADYLSIGLASLLYLWSRKRLPLALAIIAAGFLLAILALTGSRSSWIYLVGLLVLSLAWRKTEGSGHRLLFAALLFIPAFALAQWLAHLPSLQGVGAVVTPTERLFDLANGIDVRLALWREAIQIWMRYPVLGAGFGQFAWQHFQLSSEPALSLSVSQLQPDVLANALYNHSHNVLTQLAAEFGTAGLLLAVGGAIYWLVGICRQAKTLAGFWLAAVLSMLTVHSLLEYPLWYSYFLGPAMLLIGAADNHTLSLRLSGLMRAAFALMLLLAFISFVRMANTYRQLESVLVHRSTMPSVAEINRILQDTRSDSLLAPYSEFAYAIAMDLNREHLADKLELNTDVMRFAPTQEVVYREALLWALQGNATTADSVLKRALVIYPAGAENFLKLLDGLSMATDSHIAALRNTTEIFLQEQKKHAIR